MLCPNCQNEIADGARFCPVCGVLNPTEPYDRRRKMRRQKQNTRRAKALLEVLAAVLILVLIALRVFSIHNTARAVTKATLKRTLTYQYDRLIDCFPQAMKERMEEESGVSMEMILSLNESNLNQQREEAFRDGVDLDELAGKLRFHPDAARKYSVFELAQLKQEIAADNPKLAEQIKKASAITVTITAKGTVKVRVEDADSEKSVTGEREVSELALEYLDMELPMTVQAVAVKIRSNWYLLRMQDASGNDFLNLLY